MVWYALSIEKRTEKTTLCVIKTRSMITLLHELNETRVLEFATMIII